jgi:hypothetical protein
MNCRGVGKKGFSFCLRDLIFEHHFDFIGLQEIMKKRLTVLFGGSLTWTILITGFGPPL